MTYTVHKAHHNGYRCTCCHEHWEHEPYTVEDKVEALKNLTCEIPVEHPDFGSCLWSIRIVDSEDKEIGAGQMEFAPVVCRGAGYLFTRWHGHIEGEPFDTIQQDRPYKNTGGGDYKGFPILITDKTWEQIVAEVHDYHQEKKPNNSTGGS